MNILHVGAGKIGRGLIYPTFMVNHDVWMVDSNEENVIKIRNNNGYEIREREYGSEVTIHVDSPSIYTFQELRNRKKDFDVITTSVITKNMHEIAEKLAVIVDGNKKPIYIIPMENSYEAIEILRREMSKYGGKNLEGTYFLRSVIDRIIPTTGDALDIVCETYRSVIVEDSFCFRDMDTTNFILTEDIKKEFDKKYFIVNGLHACAAYLGFVRGYSYICEIMADAAIRQRLEILALCYKQYLISTHNFDEDILDEYISKTLRRFANPSIRDHVVRVGRNLLMKMSLDGRICGPYLFNKRNALTYKPFEEVIKASRMFEISADYKDYIEYCKNNLVER